MKPTVTLKTRVAANGAVRSLKEWLLRPLVNLNKNMNNLWTTNLRLVNFVKEPLIGMIPVRLLFERSLQVATSEHKLKELMRLDACEIKDCKFQ